MRVHDNGTNPLAGGGVSGAGGAQQVGGAGNAGKRQAIENKTEGDSVQLSSLGRSLKAEDIDSPERQQRVEELRADFKAGRYEVDAGELGKKLIDDAINGGF
ncbi:MAG: flagellar biosynthesis anti-sigma factor FlgM [Bryobacteraceae bacterium]|nr:flagellar biosynthesis anti-sigma factor FlgM [Bryobacteraceae bacterium]